MRVYKLQVVFADTPDGPHPSVVLPAGGTEEADLVKLLVDSVASEYLGVLRTQKQVLASVEAGIIRGLLAYKKSV